MRTLAVLVVCSVACAGSPRATTSSSSDTTKTTAGTNPLVRTDLHCTMQATNDEQRCKERGASYSLQAPLHCYGTDPGPEARERERLAFEASSEPCACISPVEIDDCSKVP